VSGSVLTVSEGGSSYNISFGAVLTGDHFSLVSDGASGTDILLSLTGVSGGTVTVSSGVTSNGLLVQSGGTLCSTGLMVDILDRDDTRQFG
jgi:hypothetical protein